VITRADGPRRLIPRWRHVDDAIDPAGSGDSGLRDLRPDVIERERAWIDSDGSSRGFALDLVAVAATAPDPSPAARSAAQWLLSDERSSQLAREVSAGILESLPDESRRRTESAEELVEPDAIRSNVKRLRQALTADPRDALAWAEQARMYTLVGQRRPAERAIAKAVALAPNHRFLLRAATRLWVHFDDPDRAKAVLLSTPRTQEDPWLMASEIAVGSVKGRSSRLIRSARALLGRSVWSPRDLTELMGALGTVELETGSSVRARDLFRKSLMNPNENSLAQAEWAAASVGGVQSHLKSALDQTPRSFEARSRAAAAIADHSTAVSESWRWLLDQPFSSEPASFGSYHAALDRDFQRSFEFARRGLQANPGMPLLLNNAAFALAQANKPADAAEYIDKVQDLSHLGPEEQAMILATRGLIAFRSGAPSQGSELYLHAIATTEVAGTRTLALLMLAAELLRLRAPGYDEAIEQATDEANKHLPSTDRAWLNYLRR
jgi:tetratricopeptide (TPR) repeat protein